MRRVFLDHWWTSHSEKLALACLREALYVDGIDLVDCAANADAEACVMSAQRIWDGVCGSGPRPIDLGSFLTPYDLESRVFAPFKAVNSPSKLALFGVPLGAFRNNIMWANREIADRIGSPPTTHAEWLEWLARASKLVPYPIRLGREDWQLSLLFELIVLSMHGADFHRRAFGMSLSSALASPRMRESLNYLKDMARYISPYEESAAWHVAAADCRTGKCAVAIIGDWAHIEFCDGTSTDSSGSYRSVYKWTAPGTETSFLFNVDYVVPVERERGFRNDEVLAKLTQTLLRPEVQGEFGLIKGALPAVRDATTTMIDSSSWKMFHLAGLCPDLLLPSMSQLQGSSRSMRDGVATAVRYVIHADGDTAKAHAFLRMLGGRPSAQEHRSFPTCALEEHDSESYRRSLSSRVSLASSMRTEISRSVAPH
ncbi:ABC transporter substrate-binding protein [Piscinibacter sp. HJYY11]|uniref:ABC transporter substrate-binding protein n=1 Tax=Piscinibacter sp. HJYY11 TaxID=2801333 RepID=UPI00191E0016|nr:ABC transporter substrate-binding protein [Piscinibacter sp. HJYY11]MBL0729636.1 carbohydrate ABC transporter substrate-binding protein [Piscinibacter sp. HJYY11]